MNKQKLFLIFSVVLIWNSSRANDTIIKSSKDKPRFGLVYFSLLRYDDFSHNFGATLQYKKTLLSLGWALGRNEFDNYVGLPFGGYLNINQKFSSKKLAFTVSFLSHYLISSSEQSSFDLIRRQNVNTKYSFSTLNLAIGPGVQWEFIKSFMVRVELLSIIYSDERINIQILHDGEQPQYQYWRNSGTYLPSNEFVMYLKMGLQYQFPIRK